jgi:hypothetical protein
VNMMRITYENTIFRFSFLKLFENFIIGFSIFIMSWMVVSYLDIIFTNMNGGSKWAYNLIVMIFRSVH